MSIHDETEPEELVWKHGKTHDDWEITPSMLDRLVEVYTARAKCPECGRVGYYIYSPDRGTNVNCKDPECDEVMRV